MCLIVSVGQEPGLPGLSGSGSLSTGDQSVGRGHDHLKSCPGQNCFQAPLLDCWQA